PVFARLSPAPSTFFSDVDCAARARHSFPTRRSSDLGKTFAALSIAVAVASGGAVFNWRAPMPKRTLYVDGEMPATSMQNRLSARSEEHTSELQSRFDLVCRLLLEKKKNDVL